MADKIVVMHDGIVEQMGTPLELYDTPGQPVRRGLHRLAGDELPQGQGEVERQRRASRDRTASSCRWRRRRPIRTAGRRSTASGPNISPSPMTAPKPRSSWSSRPARKPRSFAKLGGEQIVAVFRERHQFNPGDKIRLQARSDARASVRRDDRQATEGLSAASRIKPSKDIETGSKNRSQGGWTMHDFTRRSLLQGGTALAAAGALTGPALARLRQGLGADRAVEAGEGRQAHRDALEALRARPRTTPSCTWSTPSKAATGTEMNVFSESFDDVQPKASVAANTGSGPRPGLGPAFAAASVPDQGARR